MSRVPEIRWQLLLALLLMMACGEDVPLAPVDPPVVQTSYQVVEAFPALGFIKPIDLRDPGDGTHRLVVADQLGLVHVFENRPDVEEASIFLDLRPQVGAGLFDNGEKGLLSIAFDPALLTVALPGRSVFLEDDLDAGERLLRNRYGSIMRER